MPVVHPNAFPAWLESLPFRAMSVAAWAAMDATPARRGRIWVRVVVLGEARTLEYEIRPESDSSPPEGEDWLLGRLFYGCSKDRGLFSGPAGLQVEALRAVEARYLKGGE